MFIACGPNTLQLPFGGAELNEILPLKFIPLLRTGVDDDIAFRPINISLLRK
jgi:hypothetical protein